MTDDLQYLLDLTNKARTYPFKQTKNKALISARALYALIISMIKVSVESLLNQEILSACILTSSIIEAEIQFLWMCENLSVRGKNY